MNAPEAAAQQRHEKKCRVARLHASLPSWQEGMKEMAIAGMASDMLVARALHAARASALMARIRNDAAASRRRARYGVSNIPPHSRSRLR